MAAPDGRPTNAVFGVTRALMNLYDRKADYLIATLDHKEPTFREKIAPDYKGKVTFIAVDLDSDMATGKEFHKKLKLAHMTLTYLNPDSAVAAKYGSDHMPTTVLADPEGVIRYIRGGFEKGDVDGEVKKMKEQLAKLVK